MSLPELSAANLDRIIEGLGHGRVDAQGDAMDILNALRTGQLVERDAAAGDCWDADWWKPDPEDPFWMLEAADGEWLKNRYSLLGTRDATKAIRFPTKEMAEAHPARMKAGSKWWTAKATEHLWVDHKPQGQLVERDDEAAPPSPPCKRKWLRCGRRTPVYARMPVC